MWTKGYPIRIGEEKFNELLQEKDYLVIKIMDDDRFDSYCLFKATLMEIDGKLRYVKLIEPDTVQRVTFKGDFCYWESRSKKKLCVFDKASDCYKYATKPDPVKKKYFTKEYHEKQDKK